MTVQDVHMQLPGLEGLRVVITAGGSGLGLAIARALQAQGARLAICDVDQAALDRTGRAASMSA